MLRWLYALLVFSMLAIVLEFLKVPPLLLFIVAAIGILPLAALIGQSVEEIAEHTGERIGGLLFATFGNATELIIGILALSKGLVDVVRASIIGSVLGNVLLVLGVAVCVGGFKYGRLHFETRSASQYASLLALSTGGLMLPTIAELFATHAHQSQIVERGIILSNFVSVLLLLGYVTFILYSVFRVRDRQQDAEDEGFEPLFGARSLAAIARLIAYRRHIVQSSVPGKSGVLNHIDNTLHAIISDETSIQTMKEKSISITTGDDPQYVAGSAPLAPPLTLHASQNESISEEHTKPSLWRALLSLAVATIGVAILSEILVGTIEPMTAVLHWNAAFVGLVFLPLIGGLPEYFNTISMALNKRLDLVLGASAGSSIQIALLVAPILVLISLFTPARLDLVFSLVELAVLALATFLFSEITKDGELVWLEGLLLILLYAIMGGTVFLFGL